MAEETANALHVGIGVAATCIGVACSVYHCCCRVWRRLKGYTPTAAAGAVAAAGLMAAGQLSSVTTVGPPPNRGDAAPGVCAAGRDAPQESGDCPAAPQPQCSPPSGSQETSACGQEAQPNCSSASGPQPVSSSIYNFLFLLLAVKYTEGLFYLYIGKLGVKRKISKKFYVIREIVVPMFIC
jgi:hypothetical protein